MTKLSDYKDFTLDVAACNKAVTKIVKSSRDFAASLAQVSASVVFVALIHGNVKPARALCTGLSNKRNTPIRTNKLKDWLLENGPFDWAKVDVKVKDADGNETIVSEDDLVFNADKAKAIIAKLKTDEDKEAFAVKLISNPFWSGKGKEEKYEPFILDTAVRKFLATVERKANNAKEGDDFSGMEELRNFIKRLNVQPTAVAVEAVQPTAH